MNTYSITFLFLLSMNSFAENSAGNDVVGKKYLDMVTKSQVEVCSTNSDGTVNVAADCNKLKTFFTSPVKRQLSDLVKRNYTASYNKNEMVLFHNSVAYLYGGYENGYSEIFTKFIGEDTPKEFAKESKKYFVPASEFEPSVDSFESYSLGQHMCLKKQIKLSPVFIIQAGARVEIEALFPKARMASIYHNVSYYFPVHLDQLEACKDQSPAQPVGEDKKINNSSRGNSKEKSDEVLHENSGSTNILK
jgi:hypothetical protein